MGKEHHIIQLHRKIEELQVLESELSSIKKNAKVYKQQPNSALFFRDDHHNALNDCRKQLHKLKEELAELEAENAVVK